MSIKIVIGDCRKVLAKMPAGSIHCVVTSPPYWGLRDYGLEPVVWGGQADCAHKWGNRIVAVGSGGQSDFSTSGLKKDGRPEDGRVRTLTENAKELQRERPSSSGQFCQLCNAWRGSLGLEPQIELYIEHLVEVFRQVGRVLRDDGTLWLNMGDSMSVGTNFSQCFNNVTQGRPLIIGNPATIRIATKTGNVSLDDQRFPYCELLCFLGIEQVTIKQRNNNFSQVFYTLTHPSYCWIGAPVARMTRNAAHLEIVLDSGYDISIVITNHDPHRKSVFGILGPSSTGTSKGGDSAFAVKETAKPITEIIRDGQTIGDSFTLNALTKRLPDIYFVDQAIALRNGISSMSGYFSHFRITQATLEQLNLRLGNGNGNLAINSVRHLFTFNEYGSLVSYAELYHKTKQLSNERKAKQELGIPGMVKRALMRNGWICRSTIVWHKSNCMPESVTDRPTKAHEYVFLLSKRKRYYYDQDAVRETGSQDSHGGGIIGTHRKHALGQDGRQSGLSRAKPAGLTGRRNRRTVWHVDNTLDEFLRFATKQGMDIDALAAAFIEGQAECKDVWTIPTQAFSKWIETSRLVRVELGDVSDGMMHIRSPSCPVHGCRGCLYDECGVCVLNRIRHTDNHHDQEQIGVLADDSRHHEKQNRSCKSDCSGRTYSHFATAHNNQSHKMDPAPETNRPYMPSVQNSDHTEYTSELSVCVGLHGYIPDYNTWPDGMDVRLQDQIPHRIVDKSSLPIPPKCLCGFYHVTTQKSSHFATFPPKLVEPMIKAGTSKRGCCPECGKGWKRVVEPTKEYAQIKRDMLGKTHQDVSLELERGKDQGWGQQKARVTREVVTIGWIPTCDCYGTLPFPKYPRQGKDESDADYEALIVPIRAERIRLLKKWESLFTIPCTVLDPFAGVGTTSLVAERLGRDSVGIELSPTYAEMAKERIEGVCGTLFGCVELINKEK